MVFLLVTAAVLAVTISFPNATVNSPGISFCLKYNPEIIKLSDAKTNAILSNPSDDGTLKQPLDIYHKYFEQDKDNFPNGSFKDKTSGLFPAYFKNYPLIGIANLDTGLAIMNFTPDDAANVQTPNLGYIDAEREIEYSCR